MSIRIVVALASISLLGYVVGAPAVNNELDGNENLLNKFVEFLHQDKQLAAAIRSGEFGAEHLIRNRRQSEVNDMGMDAPKNGKDQQDGFFDRAAKFMMELLQRFLKWVNTE